MIISKTPLRMSFVGGGSDLPSYYTQSPGAVLSTSINKYIYVNVNKKFDDGIRLAYSITEEVDSISQIKHKIVKNTMEYLNIPGGIEITTIADIPSKGTGLGSSSSFTVGLLNVLKAYQGKVSSTEELADLACHIEIELCGEPIGKQDQYAAAYGGLNLIEFNQNSTVNVLPVVCTNDVYRTFESNFLMFYTGITRSASQLLSIQSEAMAQSTKFNAMQSMVSLAYDMKYLLESGQTDSIGQLLHENWLLKKSITNGVSNTFIDDCYEKALRAGATGGKLLGAGAGGFMLFYAPIENHSEICKALSHLKRIPFKFDNGGTSIIFYQR